VYIIGRGFASPLTYSLPVAVTYSSLMWVNEGSLHAQGLAYMTSTHPPPRHHPLRTSREGYDTTEREARAATTRGLSCPWELSLGACTSSQDDNLLHTPSRRARCQLDERARDSSRP
jgi:hypothetical protein